MRRVAALISKQCILRRAHLVRPPQCPETTVVAARGSSIAMASAVLGGGVDRSDDVGVEKVSPQL
jgi:hypothetical protein